MNNKEYLDKDGVKRLIDKTKILASSTPSPANGGDSNTVNGYRSDQLIQSNRNLLDNPDFRINQRGQSTYDSGNVGIYCVDRWKIVNGEATVLNGGGIEFTPGTAHAYSDIVQTLPLDEDYILTSVVTFSVSVNETIYSAVGLGELFSVNMIDGFQTELIGWYGPSYRLRFYGGDGEHTFRVNWMKLEIGSIATSFVPPNPATELLKCMRYYQIFNGILRKQSYSNDDGEMFVGQLQVPMRITPTLILPEFTTDDNVVETTTVNGFTSGWSLGDYSCSYNESSFQLHLCNEDTSKYETAAVFATQVYPIAFSAEL